MTRRLGGPAALLALAACAAAARAAMGPSGRLDSKHQDMLPEVLVKGSRRFSGYTAFFQWTLAVSPDGRYALTGDKKKNAVLWDVARGKPARVLSGSGDTVFDAAFLPDGKTALTTGFDGKVRWWDVATGKPERALDAGDPVLSLAVSPDGARLLTGSLHGQVKLWNAADATLERVLADGGKAAVASARFAAGRRAITALLGGAVTVWDLETGKALATFPGEGRAARGGFVSPDGRTFLLGGRSVRLVDVETGKPLRTYAKELPLRDATVSVSFSPDGGSFVAEDQEYALRRWDTKTGKALGAYTLGDHALGVAFLPGGKDLIAMIGSDFNAGAVIVWPVDAKADLSKDRVVPYPPTPEVKPAPPESAALGKLLFFDKRLSGDGTVSCATCHDPHKGWADGRDVAVGIRGQRGRRNTMTVLNAADHDPLLWDGRAPSLEAQARIPLLDPREMGSSPEAAARALSAVPGYRPLFAAAFGDEAITAERVLKALADFERTLIARDSPYDRYAAGDVKALGAPERRGLELFQGKARCFECHRLDSNGGSFFNIGLATSTDLGRFEVTKDERDRRAFGAPDLHNLKYTAPYMHDGQLKTLPEVVDFYDRGGGEAPGKPLELAPLGLTAAEKADLLSFLGSLSGDPLAMEPPSLPR